jgi:lipopolysaccharide/colanic/teichoic acid biosynthesis glycosyltransferase
MSLVGPRPEFPEFVAAYTAEQRQVLALRPGITGPTQLAWLGESDRFPPGVDAAQYYVRVMLPEKLQSDLRYLRTRTFVGDLGYLILTPLRLAGLVLTRIASAAVPKPASLVHRRGHERDAARRG